MSLRIDPSSGWTYGPIYESDRLKVGYSIGRDGPHVYVQAPGCGAEVGQLYNGGRVVGSGLRIPRDEWERMVAALLTELRP